MSQLKLIVRTFIFYWKKNLVLALGVAISTAVITGSLVVGDSVKLSLDSQVDLRLGNATHSLTAGDRFFTNDLADKIESQKKLPSAALLMLRGIAVADGGKQRVPGVQILGVNMKLDHFADQENYYGNLEKGEVIISENLAQKIEASIGDQLMFRIRKASLIPLNAPFVSDEETSVAVRVTVKDIAGEDKLGRLDLRNSQTSPMNAFFNLEYLNDVMELENRSNLILMENEDYQENIEIDSFAGELFELGDYGLSFHFLENQDKWELSSERVFMEDQIRDASIRDQENPEKIFTYFVNSLTSGEKSSPYSFVSSSDFEQLGENEININSWLAEDLGVGEGDNIEIEYFVVGPLRELDEQSSTFIISGVHDMDHPLADSSLMPFLPGLSDAGDCSDWETGIPIDLERIRDKDEDYWDAHRGAPKAVISFDTSTKLWANRFGECTAIRFKGGADDGGDIQSILMSNLSPRELGFMISSSKSDGKNAAANGTDFGQLFIGLSFFLLLAGIVLTIVLFMLGVESRGAQLGTFAILGFSKKRIGKIILLEGLMASVLGLILGLALTVFYNKLIFSALNGVWSDIVRTDALQLFFKPLTLIIGLVISLVVIMLGIYFSLNRFLKRKLIDLHRRTLIRLTPRLMAIKAATKWILLILGLVIVAYQLLFSQTVDAGMFFMAGGLLLAALMLFSDGILGSKKGSTKAGFSILALSIRNAVQNRGRSVAIIMLFALGVFLVVTTGANHKDLYSNADDKSSGTGGFSYVVETTVPVLHNLSNGEVRFNYGIEGDYDFVQLRRMTGDDASCLNLNKIQKPAILGLRPGDLEDRFSFATHTDDLNLDEPWLSLNLDLEGGLIPAIADQTVIQWGLGLEVGDTLIYQDEMGAEMKLLLIGGLANSIFQGNVIIADDKFLDHYPSSSGSSFFLIDNIEDGEQAKSELGRGFRDFGWDMKESVQRLAEFNSIENTYLSIFLILGALGLLLGTVGLAVVLVRNLLERKKELAMFKALGYSNALILRMVLIEYMGLLIAGLLAGGISAIIAVLPGLMRPQSEVSIGFLLVVIGIILVNGILWIYGLAYSSVRKSNLVDSLRNE